MAQHDYVIANQGFPAFRSDLNNALAAVVSNNSGATEPTTMFAHQIWVDTAADPSILKIRNADNDAWITIGTINQTGDTFKLTPAGGISTDTIAELTSAAGVTVDGVILKDSQVSTDQINEKTSAAGVTIDGVLLKDGGASVSTLNTSGAVVFNDAGADVDFRVESDTNENALFVDGATGNVGVGATPSFSVDVVRSGGDAQLRLMSQATGTNGIIFRNNAAPTSGKGAILYPNGSAAGGDTMQFVVDNAERMRIDSSGNVGIGTTSPGARIEATASGAAVQILNRTTSDGSVLEFERDGTKFGSIAVNATDNFVIECTTAGHAGLQFATASVLPRLNSADADNAVDLGELATRYDDIYATNGTIQTSDRNEKQDIEALSEAETRVAVAAKGLLKKYRWKSAVAEKGDDARIHFGIIAQDLKAAFEAEGLDAGRYAMFIHSAWWEHEVEVPAVEAKEAVYETQTDEEGNEVQVLVSEAVEGKDAYTRTDTYETEEEAPEGAVRKERMGIRYNELLAFIISAL